MKNLNDILNRLKESLSIKTDMELAEKLDLSSGVISNWKARNKIPYNEIFTICENNNFDINYIFYNKINDNIQKEENFKENIIKNLDNLNEKQLKYFYHLIESEIAKKEL
uniref:helix-turn-helix domain-containing protein n=1 Tax=Aliarcobacter sp. TaxID=2321116 RepID=UPI0040483943